MRTIFAIVLLTSSLIGEDQSKLAAISGPERWWDRYIGRGRSCGIRSGQARPVEAGAAGGSFFPCNLGRPPIPYVLRERRHETGGALPRPQEWRHPVAALRPR
jgi:hypothetical protein